SKSTVIRLPFRISSFGFRACSPCALLQFRFNPSMRNPIIAALDVQTADKALALAEQIGPFVGAFKVGSQVFTSAGPELIRRLRQQGCRIFLDLKFHDIPNTVSKAVTAAALLDVQMLTVHAAGGLEMMRAAQQSAQQAARETGLETPLVLG